MKNKKGFTLIELLAVIIILGILMIIAIPSVTSYINNSRKSAYVDTAKEIVSGARNLVNEGKLEMFDTETTYYIPVSCVSTENGQKSPYGDFVEDQAFVIVTYTGSNYNYYWISRDTTGQGVKTITPAGELDEDDIKSDIEASDITPTEPAEAGKTTIKVLSKDDCKTFEEGSITPVSKICRRVTEENDLHTKTCERESAGCGAVEGNESQITYGSIWDGISLDTLTGGNALDCDLNGNGTYDERFYYVTEKTTISTNDTAVLIYYGNISNDGTTISVPVQTNYAYATQDDINALGYNVSSYDDWHGPATAYKQLPTTTQWSNNQIIVPDIDRQITNEIGKTTTSGGTIQPFTYGKAARLLTYQEVQDACGSSSVSNVGYLNNCNYLLENVGAYEKDSGTSTAGYWLETPRSSDSFNRVFFIVGYYRRLEYNSANSSTQVGVRPVIEVLKSNIEN